jgi:nicotinamidase-related amidase
MLDGTYMYDLKGGGEMKRIDKTEFLAKGAEALESIYDMVYGKAAISIDELEKDRTVLFIIDMVKGFAVDGPLSSERAGRLIPAVSGVLRSFKDRGIKAVVLADCHDEDAEEFNAYPPHCVKGTRESEMVDELESLGGYTVIPKNSTNMFTEGPFMEWLSENGHLDTFVISGVCTDICVLQLAISIRSWLNASRRKGRVIVPIDLVDTFSMGAHEGDLMHIMALYNMMINGVEIVSRIDA